MWKQKPLFSKVNTICCCNQLLCRSIDPQRWQLAVFCTEEFYQEVLSEKTLTTN